MKSRVAYLMSWFPAVTETFILYEMLELERQGIEVQPFSLFGSFPGPTHPGSAELIARAQHAPLFAWSVLAAQLHWLRRAPATFARAWWRALTGNLGSFRFFFGAFVVVPKAMWLARKVEAAGFSHIHAHWATHPTLAALVISDLTGCTYSFTAHAHDLYVDRTMLREKIDAARFVVTISEFNRALIRSWYGDGAAGKVHIVRCGIDTDAFTRRPGRKENEVFTIACVASLREYKGHRYLIEACRMLRDRGLALRCLLLGTGVEEARLKAQIADLGLTGIVELLGAQPQTVVRDVLASVDAVVLPSITAADGQMEGIPVSLMEAMASELPVVATSLSGIPELVEDEKNGILVPERDAAALAQALERLARDPLLRRRLGVAGRAQVLAGFTRTSNAAKLRELLRPSSREDAPAVAYMVRLS
ncbi:MAG: glycosyltransferase family 4 protein [Myxococcales bacterium]